MSVAAMNKYALLNDDEGGVSVPATKQQQASKTKAAGADAANAAATTKGPASRSGNYYPRGGGRPPRNQDRDAAPAPAAEEPASGARFDRTENRGDRGRGRGRGRGGRGGSRMDRHSRTDIVDSDKQVNQGWGDTTKEVVAEAQGEADAEAEAAEVPAVAPDNEWGGGAPAADWGAGGDAGESGEAAAKEAEDAKPPRPVEEEDKTITLEEYRKTKTNNLADLVQSVELREANEGNADLFKNAEKLNKESEGAYFQGAQKSKSSKPKEKKTKETIEIDGTFSEPPGGFRGGRGRGFRGGDRGGDRGHSDRGGRGRGGGGGGGRGRGARGGPRGGGGANINVDDESAFPSL